MTPQTGWRKSSFCASNACVEISRDGDDYLMRDSKNPDQPALRFNRHDWIEFLDGISPGELGVM